jgi:hypothetical protein
MESPAVCMGALLVAVLSLSPLQAWIENSVIATVTKPRRRLRARDTK